MMITDEFIDKWADKIDGIDEDILEFIREITALAQEVRPLEWVLLEHYKAWIARGFDYDYIIPAVGDFYYLHYGDELPRPSNSIDELKKAAQADFNRRVLANLTHGGDYGA